MLKNLRNSMCVIAIAMLFGAAGCGTTADTDQDGVVDVADNCPTSANAIQTDSDGDSFGNACDNCPNNSNPTQVDQDSDGSGAACDSNDLNPLVV